MALTGDFHRLAMLRQQLAAIARGGAVEKLMPAMRDRVHGLILDGFRQQRDPYGRKWAPRRKAPDWAVRAFGLMQDNHPLLDKTGRGINSFTTRAASRRIVVRALDYMGFHQSGTRNMVARKEVPDPEMGLGPIWGLAFNRVADDVLRGMLA